MSRGKIVDEKRGVCSLWAVLMRSSKMWRVCDHCREYKDTGFRKDKWLEFNAHLS